jgi:3-oxoacyl-[acyl-carrier protein] reductase
MPPRVLITGSRKGIGKALCQYYLSQAWEVEGVSRGASSIDHVNYRHHQADVADEKAAAAIFRLLSREGKADLDLVILNAGAASMNHSLLTDLRQIDAMMSVNFKGSFIYAREAARYFIRHRKKGCIITFSSVAVPLSLEGELAYVASKAAVEAMTKVMAAELRTSNIRLYSIGPGPVATDLIKQVPADKIEALIERLPSRSLTKESEIIQLMADVYDESLGYESGTVLYLGGLSDSTR